MTQYALSFNGTNQQATTPNATDLQLTNNWEISITFSLANLTQSQKYLLSKGNNEYAIIFNYTAGKVELFDLTSTLRQYSGITFPSDGNYHTVTYRYDGTTFTSLLDNVVVTSVAVSTSLGAGSGTFYLASAGGNNYIAANVDYLGIKKNGVLTAEWKFLEGGTSTTVADDIGTHTLTTVNNPTWVTVPTNTTWLGSASPSAYGNMTASPKMDYLGSASPSAVGNLTANGGIVQSASATLSADANMSANPSGSVNGSANLSADASMSASGSLILEESVNLSADATLTANGITVSQASSSANMSADANMSAGLVQMVSLQVSMSASGSISANPVVTNNGISGSADVNATSDLTANPVLEIVAGVSMSAEGKMNVILSKPLEEIINLLGSRVLNSQLEGGLPVINGQNFEMVSGNTLYLNISLSENGQPLPLDGVTDIKWTFKNGIVKDMTTGISIVDAPNGVVQVKIDPTDTQGKMLSAKHEMKITDVQGNVSTVMQGYMTIKSNIV